MSIISSLRGSLPPAKLITNPGQVQAYLRSSQASQYLYNSNLIQSYLISEHHVTGNYDVTPDSFTFTDVVKAVPSATITSNAVTINGFGSIKLPVVLSDPTATYSVNSRAFVTPSYATPLDYVGNGDTLQVRTVSSSSYNQVKSLTVSLGSYSTIWNITTMNQFTGQTVLYAPCNGDLIDQTGHQDLYLSTGTPVWRVGPYGGTTQAIRAFNMTLRCNSPYLAFGTGDFTVEFWVYSTVSYAGTTAGIISCLNGATSIEGLSIMTGSGAVFISSGTQTFSLSPVPQPNVWNRMVLERYGSVVSCWLNGNRVAQRTNFPIYNYIQTLWIFGSRYNTLNYSMTVYVSDVRFTASARYQGAANVGVPGDYTSY